MENPRVSVIIPAYNAERTIAETISSVMAQTFTKYELIVVNDGSTDKTARIIHDLLGNDQRLKLINQENKGLAAARNCGIFAARSELIAPLDADDLWHPTYLEKQLESLDRINGAALAYAWYRIIDMESRVTWERHFPTIEGRVFSRHIYYNMIGNGSAILLRKPAALEFGGYDARVPGTEDLLLQLKIASRYRFAVTPEYLVGYRIRPDSMSSNFEMMNRSHIHTLELVRGECENAPKCAIRWKIGERLFASAVQAYNKSSLREATRLVLLASRADPIGTCFELAVFCKYRAQGLLGRIKKIIHPVHRRASAPGQPFLDRRPDEPIPPKKALLHEVLLRDRRLKYLRHIDEKADTA